MVPTKQRDLLIPFIPLYLPSFLFSLSLSLLIPVLPLFAQGFHVSYGLVGLVLAADSIGMLFADLPSGLLMRRLGQKRTMMLGIVISGLSTAALFWAPSIAWAVGLRMVSGVGVSLFSVSRHYFLAEMTPPAGRGRIISLFGGVFRAGRLLGPVLGGVVGGLFGLRAPFLAFSVLCALAAIVIARFLPFVQMAPLESGSTRQSGYSRLAAVIREHYRLLLTSGLGLLFLQMLRTGPVVIFPLYGANVLHLTVQQIGVVVSAGGLFDFAMSYPAGIVMDRFGRKYAILSTCFFLALGISLVPFTRSYTALLLVSMFAGMGGGMGAGAMLTLGSDLSPKASRSEFLGAWTLVGDIGSTSGPLITGALADWMPLRETGWAIAAAGLIAMLIFGLTVPETLKKKTAAAPPQEIAPKQAP